MNTITTNSVTQIVELNDSDLSQIDGGMDPLSIVFGLAALTATLINMINNNPESYSSASFVSGGNNDPTADLAYYDALPAGVQ